MPNSIDLRSDTVTLPTQAMRDAMYRAEVGDDMFGEDPTVRKLEELAAAKAGKEAAMLTISGTMGNLVSLLTHCGRGEEAVIGDKSHIVYAEGGGAAALGGLPYRVVRTNWQGMPDLDELGWTIRTKGSKFPPTGVVCMENTCNRRGGTVLTPEQMSKVTELAHSRGIPVHLDGARVFHAATALGVDVKEITSQVDTVMFCLSKGLSAPLGSMVAGPAQWIERARLTRRLVGGNMRQAGVIAAAGIVALTEMVDRLAEDHQNARLLAEGLAAMNSVKINLEAVQTNIVLFKVTVPGVQQEDVQASLAENGLKVSNYGEDGLRMITHYGISRQDILRALDIIGKVLSRYEASS
ncbi:MAG: aminotransferase class I/II-fold pyridoxal phosphate-dependent enzyme [Chloroflexi bacterium]|nr:aminotransferase class I/II-fold pyridoxal phosphate-dependent enzyme [Chloroflexota bacterium]